MRYAGRGSAFVWLILCGLTGCRIGEPSGVSFTRDAASNAAGSGQPMAGIGGAGAGASGAGGSAGAAVAGAGGMAGAAAGAGGSGAQDADAASAPDADEPSEIGDAGASCAPDVQGCNPVTNEGCPDVIGMQCAVDLLSDVLAGYCTFSSPPMPGACFNSGVTESCPPTSTCVDLECRTLCFCDDDCESGQCCKDPIGELGFKACGDC